MKIEKFIIADGIPYKKVIGKAEVGDIAEGFYSGNFERITEKNIEHMSGYYLWKKAHFCFTIDVDKDVKTVEIGVDKEVKTVELEVD